MLKSKERVLAENVSISDSGIGSNIGTGATTTSNNVAGLIGGDDEEEDEEEEDEDEDEEARDSFDVGGVGGAGSSSPLGFPPSPISTSKMTSKMIIKSKGPAGQINQIDRGHSRSHFLISSQNGEN